MRKTPVLLTLLLLVAVVMATSAFTHPLAVRNGVVTDYSAGQSITIRDAGLEQTYALRGNANAATASSVDGLGIGARVTVFSQCFGGGKSSTSAGKSTNGAVATNGTTPQAASNGKGSQSSEPNVANTNYCVALFVIVRQAANTSTAGTTAPAGTTTPLATSAPGTGTTGTSTPMPSMTPTP